MVDGVASRNRGQWISFEQLYKMTSRCRKYPLSYASHRHHIGCGLLAFTGQHGWWCAEVMIMPIPWIGPVESRRLLNHAHSSLAVRCT